jgi:hypothetical protein
MTVEDVRVTLSLREFNRLALIGRSSPDGIIQWLGPDTRAEIAWNLQWRTLGATLTLRYVPDDRPDEPVSRRIHLVTARLPSGGWRWWFLCPVCERRRAALYLPRADSGFACRSCHGLTYRSQRLGLGDRLLWGAGKRRRRAGGTGPFGQAVNWPPKPKGMHWRTYHRLRDEHDRLVGERDARWVQLAARVLERMRRR